MYTTLLEDPPKGNITINFSANYVEYIDNKTKNRTKFIADALTEFLEDLDNSYIKDHCKGKIQVVSISNPGEEMNKKIYKIVKNLRYFISRAELYRFALLWRCLKEQLALELQEKIDRENGIVRVPLVEERIKKCKVYKLMK